MSAGPELRASAPVHATGAVEFVALEDLAPDETFRLRPDGDVSLLATSLGRVGQLAPVDLRPWPGAGSDGPRWQVVAGFRRLAATRLLARDRVLARLHRELTDEDAWALALGEALLHEPLAGPELTALRERLLASGVAPWAEELVDEALVRAPVSAEVRERFFEWMGAASSPAPNSTSTSTSSFGLDGPAAAEPSRPRPWPPEGGQGSTPDTVEVTPEDLGADLVARLAALNQDLATALEAWKDLPPDARADLVAGVRWLAGALAFMEAER
ncbi:MAG TPA: ParB/RepB/Spo0J family partition protein [Anaeromyxobacteraceae bacterium]|nr:ParB/RepB/Spo0J family partition protein [Anaeromyxobacteraceae bacterium]